MFYIFINNISNHNLLLLVIHKFIPHFQQYVLFLPEKSKGAEMIKHVVLESSNKSIWQGLNPNWYQIITCSYYIIIHILILDYIWHPSLLPDYKYHI